MKKFNFIITCGGPYSMEYANKSVNMMRRHAGMDFDAYCITERPVELDALIHPLRPQLDVKGWWNKLLTFDSSMPQGWNVVMDVDLIIIDSIKDELEYAFSNTKQMAAYTDAINWRNCKFSSSLMIFKSGSLQYIYDKFATELPTNETYTGAGDQGWIYPQLNDVLWLDEIFPKFKRSLKFNISQRKNNSLLIPPKIEKGIKIIDFHGRPKPHEVLQLPFVKDNWK